MTPRGRSFWPVAALLIAAAGVTACAHGKTDVAAEKVSHRAKAAAESQIGVNGFLWQAALETLSFAPLTQADQKGGVIITDWFTDVKTPSERFKTTVYILDTRLRADAVKVSVFKQVKDQTGTWVDSQTDPDTPQQIENAILRQARELKLSTLGNN